MNMFFNPLYIGILETVKIQMKFTGVCNINIRNIINGMLDSAVTKIHI